MPQIHASAWDPTRPAVLCLPSSDMQALHTLKADTGSGCNEAELTALLQLLQAHTSANDNAEAKQPSLTEMFALYRQAVSECVAEWPQSENEEPPENLDFLGMHYAVLHLCSIVLPLLVSSHSQWMQDPMNVPGLATADMVRYLRYNHLEEIDVTTLTTAQDESYWPTLMKLVLRGCLQEAWELLTKHSLYQAACVINVPEAEEEADPQYLETLRMLQHKFQQLRELMYRAPLPAGRTDVHDNDVMGEEGDDDEGEQQVEGVYLLDDLPVSATDYLFWESTSSSSSGHKHRRTTTADVPTDFQPDAAQAKHQLWQDYVKEFRLDVLGHHLPELQAVLRILSGDLRGIATDTWAEAWLAELLYCKPAVAPRHLGARAARIVEARKEETHILQALLSILKGNAGQALELLHHYGGGTGAALPATLLALLFCLFVDSNILPADVADRKVDFVCQAASAILSSLCHTKHHDTGVQLAIRLLLPYQEEAQVRSFLAEVVLEPYEPTTEAYCKAALLLVRPLVVERKSLQIMDGCISAVLALHFRLLQRQSYQAGISVLWEQGMSLEAALLPEPALGACYRTLTKLCLENITIVLKWSLNPQQDSQNDAARHALAMSQAIQAVADQQPKVKTVPEVSLVVHGVPLANALVLQKYNAVCDCVAQLLQADVDPDTGTSIFRPALHTLVLQAAHMALDNDAGFDLAGMNRLMELYLQLTALDDDDDKKDPALETALAQGLSRAFCVENARKQKSAAAAAAATNTLQYNDYRRMFEGMNTCNLHLHSLDLQEKFVQNLLDS